MHVLWLYVLVGGFLSGVWWRSLFDLGDGFLLWLFVLAIACLCVGVATQSRALSPLCALFLFAAALGVLRTDAVEPPLVPVLSEYVGQRIVAEGILIDEPDERADHTKLTLAFHAVEGVRLSEPQGVLIVTEVHPRRSYGDVLRISGVLEVPENFSSGSGRDFDYVSYLEKDDIRYQVFYPEIEVVGAGSGNPIKGALFALKRMFLTRIQKVIPDPQAALLGGLVVGAKQSLGEALLERFRATGIIHIVVLSGYNVTIVAEAIMRALAFLPQAVSFSIGGVAIILFAIMTGASATIVRASVMALIVLIARLTGRTYEMLRALLIAAMLMVAHNPEILLNDPSFQLSFLATLGLILVAPRVEPYLTWLPERFQFRTIAAATISTQIFVLPWILYLMGELSLVALPVNLLVLVTVPITMLGGFLTGTVGMLSTLASLPFAYLSHVLLSYQLWVTEVFASFPFASVKLETVPLAFVLLCYGVYAFWLTVGIGTLFHPIKEAVQTQRRRRS